MKTISLILLIAVYIGIIAAETATIMKPMSGEKWVHNSLANVEWKYTDFNVTKFRTAVVDLMRDTPENPKGQLIMKIHEEGSFANTGVAFSVPADLVPGDDYYVRLTVFNQGSDLGFEAKSEKFSILDKSQAPVDAQVNKVSSISNTTSSALRNVGSSLLAVLVAAFMLL